MGEQIAEMVLVEWHDACLFTGTHTKEESIQKQMGLFKSLGYLISKDSTTTRIAFEQDDEGKYRGITLIPSGSIVSIKKLLSEMLK